MWSTSGARTRPWTPPASCFAGASRGAADRVRSALGGGTVVVASDTLRRVDVTVILGWDFQPAEESHP